MKTRHILWKKRIALLLMLCIAAVTVLAGCGANGAPAGQASVEAESAVQNEGTPAADSSAQKNTDKAPEIAGLTFTEHVKNDFATQFDIYKYEGGYAVFDIHDEGQFLLVPDGAEVPENLPDAITVLNQPKHIYLAATAMMALFTSMDALDVVTLTSLQESGWTFDEPKEALANGTMKFAGKYSEPDYEMLLEENCDLAIESTMIYHTPEVQEMIEELGIPVLVDRSSYESNPLGRAEWIKLYGVMTGHEEEAKAFFDEQKQVLSELDDFENTELTVALFYVSTDGKVVVRASTDYVPAMIEMAGGRYIFKDVTDESGRSSIPMSVEMFYDIAENADIIIYNSSIDSSVKTLDDLKAKDPVFENLKAVKEGNCWLTGGAMYQRTDIAASMIMDFHNLFIGNTEELVYLSKLS